MDIPDIITKKKVLCQNWAETFSCIPEDYVEPDSVEQLIKIIKYAQQHERKVKVWGNGHSPSDIACTEDIIVCLKKLNRVLNTDKDRKLITVEAGMLLSDLNLLLEENGMALSVLPAISDVTLGGAVAVSTHGSGIKFGTLSSYIVDLELLAADGSLVSCSSERNNDIFRAACCGLGAIGVIVRLTLQCEDAYYLMQRNRGEKLTSVLENLRNYLASSDHVKFLWYPHTDYAIASFIDRTKATRSDLKTAAAGVLWRLILSWSGYLFDFLFWLSTYWTVLVPLINHMAYFIYSHQPEIVDISYKIFVYNCLCKQFVSDCENTVDALLEIKDWLDRNNGIFFAHFPIEVRFVKANNLYISPASGRDTAHINIIMYRPYGKDVPKEKYWTAYERIMRKYGGRPHWAKEHVTTPEDLNMVYPYFKDWCRVRSSLDPAGMFVNDNISRILPTL